MTKADGFFGSLVAAVLASAIGMGSAVAQTTAPPAVPQAAPNPCTSVPEGKCGTVAGCVWLPGYKVKGGPDVQGYCRLAPKPLSSRRTGDPVPKP